MKNNSKFELYFWLKIAATCVFLGRAWQHLFVDAPYRALIWDEKIMKYFIENVTSLTWHQFVTSADIDGDIQFFVKVIGGLFLLAAAAVWVLPHRLSQLIVALGFSFLVLLAWLYFKENFYQWGQFWEYSLQICPSLLLLLFATQKADFQTIERKKNTVTYLKWATAITFFCHGLFAVGYYPRPGEWVQMGMNFLRISEPQAAWLLYQFGVADFIFCFLLLATPFQKISLLYFIFWGFVTTFSRLYANFHFAFWQDFVWQWTPEFLYRVPHFLIPWVIWKQKE